MSKKLGLLASLYLAQGLPFGFFTQALPAIMRERSFSLEAIGLTSLLALPWALKFLWAPFVELADRRRFILAMQAITAVLLIVMSRVSPDASMTPILICVVVVNLLSATQDIATDGLAVDMLDEAERGLANGIQVAGYRVGMIIGGGALLLIYDQLQWSGTFLIMAVLVAITSIPVFRHRAPQRPPRPVVLPTFLRRSGVLRLLAIIFTYKIGAYLLQGMLRPFLIDGGLSLSDVGIVLGTVGFTAGLVGALVGGALVNRLGRRRAVVLFAGFQSLTILAFAPLATMETDLLLVTLLAGLEHLASGMATAALFTCMMDWCSERSSASDYTLQASFVVIATGAASSLSGFSAAAFGYSRHFLLAGVVSLLGMVIAALLFPRTTTSS